MPTAESAGMQEHRLHYLGIELCHTSPQLIGQTESLGTWTNHVSLS